MYKITPGTDLSFLAERVLIQVCIGQHEMILHFDESVSVTVMSSIKVSHPLWGNVTSDFYAAVAQLVSTQLGFKTASVRIVDNTILEVLFENEVSFHLIDDSEHYESFIVTHPDGQIVV